MNTHSISLAIITCLLGVVLTAPVHAIDCNKKPDHPQCSDAGTGAGRDFRITIDIDGALTDAVFEDMEIACTIDHCDLDANLSIDDGVLFSIPASYYDSGLWTLDEAEECFGAPLDGVNPANVPLLRIHVRDHHGDPEQWSTNVDYLASFIDSPESKTHHAHFLGTCTTGSCADLPPADGITNTYDNGYLTRTQVATRGRTPKGTACTCAWEGCPVLDVTVTVEEVTPP